MVWLFLRSLRVNVRRGCGRTQLRIGFRLIRARGKGNPSSQKSELEESVTSKHNRQSKTNTNDLRIPNHSNTIAGNNPNILP